MASLQLEKSFREYEAFHRSKGNKITHYIGIPMIVFSLLGLLARVGEPPYFDLGFVLWIFATLFYVRLSPKWGSFFAPVTFAAYWFSQLCSLELLWVLFILGWIFQGVGHWLYEKKSPAFLKNFEHVLIGPFWIFVKLFSARSSPKA